MNVMPTIPNAPLASTPGGRVGEPSLRAAQWRLALDRAMDDARRASPRPESAPGQRAGTPGSPSPAVAMHDAKPSAEATGPTPEQSPTRLDTTTPSSRRDAGPTAGVALPEAQADAGTPGLAAWSAIEPSMGAGITLPADEAAFEMPAPHPLPALLPEPTTTPWPAVNAHASVQGRSVSAALRDAEVDPLQADALKQRLAGRLAAAGLSLAELRVNGRVVGELPAPCADPEH